jgi:ribosomal protein RSM22 (predicted rRNA methylase)
MHTRPVQPRQFRTAPLSPHSTTTTRTTSTIAPPTQVLGLERRRRQRALGQAVDEDGGEGDEEGGVRGPPGAAVQLDNNAAARLSKAGAHVVAPCAHDGTCPMQARAG